MGGGLPRAFQPEGQGIQRPCAGRGTADVGEQRDGAWSQEDPAWDEAGESRLPKQGLCGSGA